MDTITNIKIGYSNPVDFECLSIENYKRIKEPVDYLQEFFKYDKCIKFEEINDFNEKIIINDFSFIYKYNLI